MLRNHALLRSPAFWAGWAIGSLLASGFAMAMGEVGFGLWYFGCYVASLALALHMRREQRR